MTAKPPSSVESFDKDTLHRARQVLFGAGLVCCRELPGHLLQAVFNADGQSGHLVTVTVPAGGKGRRRPDSAAAQCAACPDHPRCDHAAAALLHWGRHPVAVAATDPAETEPPYRGLRSEPLLAAAEKILRAPDAELILRVEGEMPHAASKWESCAFRVDLRGGGRTYLGNLNNLRQLHFRDALVGGLRIGQFPTQDRQIIRFLAVTAEGEGNCLAMPAETTAEFFHSLVGFPRLYWGNRKIVVHRQPATPIMLYRTDGDDWLLQPALRTEAGHLPLRKPRLVMGRAGCWIGMAGEYWWLPGVYDLPGLRNFIRGGEERVNPKDMAAFLEQYADRPVPLVSAAKDGSPKKAMKPVYTMRWRNDGTLTLKLSFDYAGTTVGAGEGGLGQGGGQLWRRDMAREESCANELLRFGFRRPKGHPGDFELHDAEAIGQFLDNLLPGWLKAGREVLQPMTAAAVAITAPATLHCRIKAETATHFDLALTLVAGDGRHATWADAIRTAEAGRNYLAASEGAPLAWSPAMRELVLATVAAVEPLPDAPDLVRLVRAAAPAWCEHCRRAGSPPPRRLQAIARKMPPKPDPEMLAETADPTPPPAGFHGELRPYQRLGIAWLGRMLDHGFNPVLADEMGLGKTVQALVLLATRRTADTPPDLVLCPTSLVENWAQEATRFLPGMRVLALRGPQRERLWPQVPHADLVVSSYALVRRDLAKYQEQEFHHLILDEAQHIKNPETANARACKAIRAKYRLVLTGTPLENRPDELWSIFDFLHPAMLGTHAAFQRRFGDLTDNPARQQQLADATGPLILRRRKAEVARDLPPKTEQVIYCEMDEPQRAVYERLLADGRDSCRRLLAGGNDGRFAVLTALLRLRQLCCHPRLLPPELLPDDEAELPLPSAKTELLQELLLEAMDSGSRTLVFSQFTSLLAILRQWLEAAAIPYEYLDGATTDRLARVNRFNRDDSNPVFLLSLKAGGQGLNLTGADRVILYDPWWNPAVEDQAADRTHRIGQERHVNSLKLVVRDSIEERILALQAQKRQLFDALIEQPAAATLRGLHDEDLAFLLDAIPDHAGKA